MRDICPGSLRDHNMTLLSYPRFSRSRLSPLGLRRQLYNCMMNNNHSTPATSRLSVVDPRIDQGGRVLLLLDLQLRKERETQWEQQHIMLHPPLHTMDFILLPESPIDTLLRVDESPVPPPPSLKPRRLLRGTFPSSFSRYYTQMEATWIQ